MFQIFLIAAYIFAFDLASTQLAVAANKAVPTMEELNAHLKAKKAELEPFDQKSVKVDVESLGLDDIDKKPAEKKEDKKIEEQPKAAEKPIEEKPADQSKIIKTEEVKKAPEEGTGIVSKMKNVISGGKAAELPNPNPEPLKAAVEPAKLEEKKPTEKYINSQKKKSLKKRLAEEKRRKQNEKRQQEKLKKLNELREQYLIKIDENVEEVSDEDFADSDEKIVPQKKNLNRFTSEELPPQPILNRYRTADNLHIPTIPTPQEQIDMLFSAVVIGSISFFNDAYKNVENPNVRNRVGDTILNAATLLQRYPVIASVLKKGADPNLPNGLGYTPISIAIEMSDIKSLELLVDNGADIFYTDKFDRTYLMHAVRVGFLPAVELFVTKGLDVNAMDSDGFTPLSIAYRHKKEVIVKYLLKKGAKTWVEKPYEPEKQFLIKELENRWK